MCISALDDDNIRFYISPLQDMGNRFFFFFNKCGYDGFANKLRSYTLASIMGIIVAHISLSYFLVSEIFFM